MNWTERYILRITCFIERDGNLLKRLFSCIYKCGGTGLGVLVPDETSWAAYYEHVTPKITLDELCGVWVREEQFICSNCLLCAWVCKGSASASASRCSSYKKMFLLLSAYKVSEYWSKGWVEIFLKCFKVLHHTKFSELESENIECVA